MKPCNTRILYIGGWGRSGSTLVGQLLGLAENAVFVGELNHLFWRGVQQNRDCACGLPFASCPFWCQVADMAFGGWKSQIVEAALAPGNHGARHRQVPSLMLGARRQRVPSALRDHARVMEALYGAIADVTGRVVVDSSKSPAHAWLLACQSLDVRVAHLVRDPRGVAFSWMKTVEEPDAPGQFMAQYTPVNASGYWLVDNWLFHPLARRVPSVRIRYEDFAADPRGALCAMAELGGLTFSEHTLEELGQGRLTLPRDHSVSGNPIRFREGPVRISADQKWRMQMPRNQRCVVSLITTPLRRRYEYRSGL